MIQDKFFVYASNSQVVNFMAGMGARPSEVRVGTLVMTGLCNKQIARELQITESTVKCHITSLLRLAHVQNRVQLAHLLYVNTIGKIGHSNDPLNPTRG
jgi:DNA-binding NarL/FixJ family response regulator